MDKNEHGIFVELSQRLVNVDFSVFRFDFRACGESEGDSVRDFTVSGQIRDIEASVKFLEKKGYKTFGLLGASFAGGAVSIFTAQHLRKIRALALWNALINYSLRLRPTTPWGKKYWGKPAIKRIQKFGFTEIGSRKFRVGKALMEDIEQMEPRKELIKADIPILFVHGDKDTYVDYHDSVKYAKMMKNAKLVIIKGAEHGFHNQKDSEMANKATVDFFLKNV